MKNSDENIFSIFEGKKDGKSFSKKEIKMSLLSSEIASVLNESSLAAELSPIEVSGLLVAMAKKMIEEHVSEKKSNLDTKKIKEALSNILLSD